MIRTALLALAFTTPLATAADLAVLPGRFAVRLPDGIRFEDAATLPVSAGTALQGLRLAGFRRAPVVDARGALIGIMTLDDAIEVITGLMCDLAGSIKSEQRQERRRRTDPPPPPLWLTMPVLMPTSSPRRLTRAPPELPGLMAASV